MNIIIPYKHEVHNGVELKYALRSIQKHLTGWTDVIIMGDPPHWYKGNSVPFQDSPGRKEYNIYSKILAAPVEGDFVFWNDDHFLLKPLDVSEIKYWHNGTLDPDKNGGARNRLAIQNTLAILNQNNALNYDIHTPIIYDKYCFGHIFRGLRTEVSIKSLYVGYINTEHSSYGSQFMEDLKIQQWFERDKLIELTKDRLFFSTGTSLSTPTIEYLAELYQEPSKWEI